MSRMIFRGIASFFAFRPVWRLPGHFRRPFSAAEPPGTKAAPEADEGFRGWMGVRISGSEQVLVVLDGGGALEQVQPEPEEGHRQVGDEQHPPGVQPEQVPIEQVVEQRHRQQGGKPQ